MTTFGDDTSNNNDDGIDWRYLIMNHICPAAGVILSTLMYSAAISDLKQCILCGSLGSLNPIPWAIQMGNCFGWIIYAFYQSDLYLLGANLPGFLASLWLNYGAVKLQFLERYNESLKLATPEADADATGQSIGLRLGGDSDTGSNLNSKEKLTVYDMDGKTTESYSDTDDVMDSGSKNDNNNSYDESLVFLPQERLLAHVIVIWSAILVLLCFHLLPMVHNPARWIGLLVNVNLIFFFAAPLQTMATVIRKKSSETIHVGTTLANIANTSFWCIYGVAQQDVYILIPNGTGLVFGLLQGGLCLMYPSSSSSGGLSGRGSSKRSGLGGLPHTSSSTLNSYFLGQCPPSLDDNLDALFRTETKKPTETSKLLRRYQTQPTSHLSSIYDDNDFEKA